MENTTNGCGRLVIAILDRLVLPLETRATAPSQDDLKLGLQPC
jgi:hypothetical protein